MLPLLGFWNTPHLFLKFFVLRIPLLRWWLSPHASLNSNISFLGPFLVTLTRSLPPSTVTFYTTCPQLILRLFSDRPHWG